MRRIAWHGVAWRRGNVAEFRAISGVSGTPSRGYVVARDRAKWRTFAHGSLTLAVPQGVAYHGFVAYRDMVSVE